MTVERKVEIQRVLCILILIASFFHAVAGIFGVVGSSKFDDPGLRASGVAINILTVFAGITGLIAVVLKNNPLAVGTFSALLLILMGINIGAAVDLCKEWGNLLSDSSQRNSRGLTDVTVSLSLAIALAASEFLAVIASFVLFLYALRDWGERQRSNPASGKKKSSIPETEYYPNPLA